MTGSPTSEVEVRDVLAERGAVLEGHFRLSSGRHSDLFVQKFRVFERPKLTQRFGAALADRFEGKFEVVASPAVGAIPLGFATALAANVRFVMAERVNNALELRRGFTLAPREKVLVVEDVITTGSSATEVIDLVRDAGAEPVGLGVLIDRADETRGSFSVPLRALATVPSASYAPEECRLCAAGVPLDDPGSRRLA